MTIFDLLFIVLVLSTVVLGIRFIWLLAGKKREQAFGLAKKYATALGIYLTIVMISGIATPRRVLQPGERQCFDDWCIALQQATPTTTIGAESAYGVFQTVVLEVSSRARRVQQAAPDAKVFLRDGDGHEYDVSKRGQAAWERDHGPAKPLGSRLDAQTSFTTVRVFDVPATAKDLVLRVSHGGWPGWFIIGENGSLFHKGTVIRLNAPR
jgi:hypothetical protein